MVVPDPSIFFRKYTLVADHSAVNPNDIKTLLANGVSTLFINTKPALANEARIFSNPPFCVLIFLVVPFNEISVFFKDLITFTKSFTLLFVSVIAELLIFGSSFYFFRNNIKPHI